MQPGHRRQQQPLDGRWRKGHHGGVGIADHEVGQLDDRPGPPRQPAARVAPGPGERRRLLEKLLEPESWLGLDAEVRLALPDVAKRMVRACRCDDSGPRPPFDPLAADSEPNFAGEDLEPLFLPGVMVRRNVSAWLREDLGPEDVAIARERNPLTTHGIVNELWPGTLFHPTAEYKSPMSDIANGTRSSRGKRRVRRRLPAPQRRETLIAAASELFAQRGFDRVSLDEVAERAGVTKVIVYRHFGSKKGLYLQLLAIHRDALLRTLAEGLADKKPLADRVPAVADAWFSYVENHPFAWAMLFQDVTGDPEIRAFHAGMRDTARAAIAGLIADEPTLRLEPELVEPVAELLRSAMTGLALWWLEHRDVHRTLLVETITQTTWYGLVSATK